MKHSIIFTGIIALALSSQLVSAGSITDTYATGDTLTATKMDNIKTAVNDNDARVGAIETQTSNLITGCPTNQSIRSIAADGAIACEVDSIGSGDITGVTAGSGLSGGGTSGNVTLNLAPNIFIPIAYGMIDSDGTIASSTSNISSSVSGTTYTITIAGESYYFGNYITIITAVGAGNVCTESSVSGNLIILCEDSAGNPITSRFQFVTFKP